MFPTLEAKTQPNRRTSLTLWAILAAIAVVGISISTQSLWIDEGGTAFKAIQPTLGAWWTTLMWEQNSNLQLPLYLLYVWGWEKFFGSSEWALRAANIPPFFVCLAALHYTYRDLPRVHFWALMLLLTNSFVWFYLNEARPYIFLLASASFLFGSIYRLAGISNKTAADIPHSWFVIFSASAVAVTATSMLAALWVIFSFAAACILRGMKFPGLFLRRAPVIFLGMLFGGACLGAYYLWTLRAGPQIPRFGQQIAVSILHSAYELLGFTGLGPARLTLRTEGAMSLIPFVVPIGLFGLCWGIIVTWSFRLRAPFNALGWRKLCALGALVMPAVLVFAIGHFEGVRVSPRYLVPLLPLVIAYVATGLNLLWEKRAARGLVVLFFIFALISAFQIRFAPRHAKENYREAAAFAKAQIAQGRTVCWAADVQTAIYYDLIKETERDAGSLHVFLGQTIAKHEIPKNCTVVVLSRLDVYDGDGKIRDFIAEKQMREAVTLTSFHIYLAAPEQVNPSS